MFNGFLQFLPDHGEKRRKAEAVLHKMIRAFEDHPQKVLNRFWQNAFSPDKIQYTSKGKPDSKRLFDDLKILTSSTFDLSLLDNGASIISLDGGADQILTINRGKKFTELTRRNAVYHFIKEAGHSLPVTHFQDCWSFISAMIPIFQHNGNYRRKEHQ